MRVFFSHTLAPLAAAALLCTAAQAQTPAPAEAPSQPALKGDQRIERITVEDAGSRVDEVRYGGQTQSINVQPKNNAPAYEVQTNDGTKAKPMGRDGHVPTGPRVWNVLSF